MLALEWIAIGVGLLLVVCFLAAQTLRAVGRPRSVLGKTIQRGLAAVARFVALPFASVCIFASGMNGIFWFASDDGLRAPGRALLLVGGIMLAFTHFQLWARRHGRQFREANFPDPAASGLTQVTRQRAATTFQSTLLNMGVPQADFAEIVQQLITPRLQRERMVERLSLSASNRRRSVEITFRTRLPRPSPASPLPARYLVASRPEKGRTYDNLEVDTSLCDVTSYVETCSLVYGATVFAADNVRPPGMATLPTSVILEIARAIAAPVNDVPRIKAVYRRVVGADYDKNHASADQTAFFALLKQASGRRPLLVRVPDVERPVVKYSYDEPAVAKEVFRSDEDRWRFWKARVRTQLGLPPTTLGVDVARARSVESYQLFVNCPAGMQVAEVAGWEESSRKWLPRLKRDALYSRYIGWRIARYQATATFATQSLGRTAVARPVFLVRMTEQLPGTLGFALGAGFASLLAVWLCGALAPNGSYDGVDLVAFALALPAVLAASFGLGLGGTARGYRNLTATISLFVTTLVSLLGIALYLARGAERVRPFAIFEVKSIFVVSDLYWAVLLLLSVVNLSWVTGTFVIRVLRVRMAMRV